jgi:hypothetical protein
MSPTLSGVANRLIKGHGSYLASQASRSGPQITMGPIKITKSAMARYANNRVPGLNLCVVLSSLSIVSVRVVKSEDGN